MVALSDERAIIGGRTLPLRKSDSEFHVLSMDRGLIEDFRRSAGVATVAEVARGIWRVRLTSTRDLESAMTWARARTVAHHRYDVEGDELGSTLTITDLVSIKPHDSADILGVCDAYGLTFRQWHGGGVATCRVTAAAGANPLKVLHRLRDDARLEFAEPDFVLPLQKFSTPLESRPGALEQWHLHGASPRLGVNGLAHVRALDAWRTTRGDPAVVVAVMDDGFDLSNDDLRDRVVRPSDFTRRDVTDPVPANAGPDDASPLPEANRGDFHGTPCAGLAIARGEATVSGVAPGCSWMPVRFDVGGSSQSLTLGIFEYLSAHADVVSCSWGFKPSAYVQFSDTARAVLADLIDHGGRRGKGLVICFAAGNYNLPTYLRAEDNSRGLEYYGSSGTVLGRFFKNREILSGWTQVPGVIVVSAVTARRRKSLYSNWGAHITVCAPSDNWHPRHVSTRADVGSINLTTTDNDGCGLGLVDVGLSRVELGRYTHDMGGTSSAAPLVAGACALMISVNPDITPAGILEALRVSASKTLNPTLDVPDLYNNQGQSGAFDASGHSSWFGYGLLDVAAAVQAAAAIGGG